MPAAGAIAITAHACTLCSRVQEAPAYSLMLERGPRRRAAAAALFAVPAALCSLAGVLLIGASSTWAAISAGVAVLLALALAYEWRCGRVYGDGPAQTQTYALGAQVSIELENMTDTLTAADFHHLQPSSSAAAAYQPPPSASPLSSSSSSSLARVP